MRKVSAALGTLLFVAGVMTLASAAEAGCTCTCRNESHFQVLKQPTTNEQGCAQLCLFTSVRLGMPIWREAACTPVVTDKVLNIPAGKRVAFSIWSPKDESAVVYIEAATEGQTNWTRIYAEESVKFASGEDEATKFEPDPKQWDALCAQEGCQVKVVSWMVVDGSRVGFHDIFAWDQPDKSLSTARYYRDWTMAKAISDTVVTARYR
jgi:hypothetical protein